MIVSYHELLQGFLKNLIFRIWEPGVTFGIAVVFGFVMINRKTCKTISMQFVEFRDGFWNSLCLQGLLRDLLDSWKSYLFRSKDISCVDFRIAFACGLS